MRLHLVERARIANGIVDLERLGLAGDVLVAIAWVRVVAQPLRTAGTALGLDGLEHVRHVARVVAGAGHDLCALDVRLFLVLSTEPQERRTDPELSALCDDASPPSADDGPEDAA